MHVEISLPLPQKFPNDPFVHQAQHSLEANLWLQTLSAENILKYSSR